MDKHEDVTKTPISNITGVDAVWTAVIWAALFAVSWLLSGWLDDTRADESVVFSLLGLLWLVVIAFLILQCRRHCSIWLGGLQGAIAFVLTVFPIFRGEPGDEPLIASVSAGLIGGAVGAIIAMIYRASRHRRILIPFASTTPRSREEASVNRKGKTTHPVVERMNREAEEVVFGKRPPSESGEAPLKKIVVRFGPKGIVASFRGGGIGFITRKNPAFKPKSDDPEEIVVTKLLDDIWSEFGDNWLPQKGVSTYSGDDLEGFAVGLLKREGLLPKETKELPPRVTFRMSNALFSVFTVMYIFETEAYKDEFVKRMTGTLNTDDLEKVKPQIGHGYNFVLIKGETGEETPAYQQALKTLVQEISSEPDRLAGQTQVQTFWGPDLPHPDDKAAIEGYIRAQQMILGIGLLAFDVEFRQSGGYNFMIAYMKK